MRTIAQIKKAFEDAGYLCRVYRIWYYHLYIYKDGNLKRAFFSLTQKKCWEQAKTWLKKQLEEEKIMREDEEEACFT